MYNSILACLGDMPQALFVALCLSASTCLHALGPKARLQCTRKAAVGTA